MKTSLLTIALVGLLLSAAAGHAQSPPAAESAAGLPGEQATFQLSPNAPKYAPDRLLVRFRHGTPKFRTEAAHAAVQGRVVRSYKAVPDLELVRLREGMAIEAALNAYRKDPAVLYAEPDYTVWAEVIPNDPFFVDLWGMHNTGQNGGTADADIDAPEAWDITTGSSDVVVAVIDTGIDYEHGDLNANMFRNELDCNSNGVDDDGNGFIDDCHGIDTFNGDSDPWDDHSHGTHVAGTIGAVGNNAFGVVGVNWQVKLVACKFLDEEGFGFTSGAIACLEYLAEFKDRGVNLVATNNSWGGRGFSQALLEAIDAHRQRGILFIAAAGNGASDNDASDFFPSNHYLPNLIAVAATDRTDARSSFSNFGRHSVHLGAPGSSVLSTTPANTLSIFSGTSMATPHVTGVAALLKARNPLRDWKAIKNLLLAGGDTIASMTDTISQKRLNAHGALTCSNSILRRWLQPRALTASPGFPVDLAVLHINCANPNGGLDVTVNPGGEVIPLLDDGLGADQEPSDGIYSGQWTPSAPGIYTLAFPGGEALTVQVLSPYRFTTSAFSYRTISGQSLDLRDDDSRLIMPGFPILFGGASFDSLFVNSNGNITFTDSFLFNINEPLPVAARPTLVAAFWDDLSPRRGTPQNVFWEVIGVAPNRELVVEWRDVPHCYFGDTTATVKFQVVFFEGSSDILFNYADVTLGPENCALADQGASATVGVQVGLRVATQFSFDTPSLSDGLAILWELGHQAPVLSQLSPFTALAGDPGFVLEVLGQNFVPASVVRWGGIDRQTTFVSSSELQVAIASADIAGAASVQVTVFTPAPGGGVSGALAFDIHASHPVPLLLSVSPAHLLAGLYDETLTVTGSQFVTGSVVRWNGSDRQTRVFNQTTLTAVIPASDFALPGTAELTVFNPAPGGGSSNPFTITIENAVPVAGGLQPIAALPGGPAFELFVTGWGFTSSSVVRWNGADRPTTFFNQFGLHASIPASDIAAPGTAQVTVFNPAPGGGTSNALTFFIAPPPPNDNFANAIDITALPLPFSHTVDTHNATTEFTTDPEPLCGNHSNNQSVWYRFTPNANVTVVADTFGSDYDTILSAWTGTPGSFSPVTCNDDAGSIQSWISFQATAGTTYSLMVSDFFADGGSLVFNLSSNAPLPNATFQGTVKDVSGALQAGVTVAAYQSAVLMFQTTTASNGSYSLFADPGIYDLVASKAGFFDSTRAGMGIAANQTLTGIDFTLFRHSFFQGRVTNRSDGAPIEGAVVEARKNGVVQFSTTTAADGTYSLLVRKGRYSLRASAPGFNPRRKRDQRVGDGRTKTGIDFALTPQ